MFSSRLAQHPWNSATSSPTPGAPLPAEVTGRLPEAREVQRHGRPVASSPAPRKIGSVLHNHSITHLHMVHNYIYICMYVITMYLYLDRCAHTHIYICICDIDWYSLVYIRVEAKGKTFSTNILSVQNPGPSLDCCKQIQGQNMTITQWKKHLVASMAATKWTAQHQKTMRKKAKHVLHVFTRSLWSCSIFPFQKEQGQNVLPA